MDKTKSPLQAGAGRARIVIPKAFFPYRSFRGRYFSGEHDPIYARAILIKNESEQVLMVSIELADLGEITQWQGRISDVCGVDPDHIIITVSHNHLAPHVSDDWNQQVEDVEKTLEFSGYVWNAVEQAVRQAVESLRPATVASGNGRCDININRDYLPRPHSLIDHNPHGLSDKTVSVVRFSDLEGEPIAFFINYSVHGSVMMNVKMEDGGMHVSGDLPGATSRYVENAYQSKPVAIWTSGAAADQNPKYMVFPDPTGGPGGMPDFAHFKSPGVAGFMVVEMQARSLADEVLWVSDRMDNDQQLVSLCGIQRVYLAPGQKPAGNLNQGNVFFRYEDASPVRLRLSVWTVNDILFVGIPGEIVTSIGMNIKQVLAAKSHNIIVVTHCNGSLSYMTDEVGFALRSGEAMRTHVSRGWAERSILEGLVQLTADVR